MENPEPSTRKKTLNRGGGDTKHTEILIPWKSLKDFFPSKTQDKLSKIRMTKEGLYSSSPIAHSMFMRDLIKLFYPKKFHSEIVVTDATSCIGGTFLAMFNSFGHINAVELSPLHAEIMDNNLKALFPKEHKKVNIVNDNYLTVWDSFEKKSNVTIIDPPWGGTNYIRIKNMKLYLLDKEGTPVELVDIINMVLPKNDIVMVRVPFNYDRKRLKNVESKFSGCVKFLKEYPRKDKRTKAKTKISYYIYMFSNFEPIKPLTSLDPVDYPSQINYRQILFEEL